MKYKILLVLFLISLASSLILSFNSSKFCVSGEGCNIVTNSIYSSFLKIPNSNYGIGIFAFLFILTLSHIRKPKKNKSVLIKLSIIFGSLVALYFLYIQHFVLKSYCKLCLVVDFSLLMALFVLIFMRRK